MESYKNILANKFMRDTNYIIIKDTDDLEELERQYELFNSQLTMRQQRLSDDRSIEIWNMTNKEHYESLKIELIKKIDSKFGNEDSDKEYDVFSYEPEDDIGDDEITNILNADLDSFEIPDDDNDITEPVKEDSIVPIKNNDTRILEPERYYAFLNSNNQDTQKDNMADQYEIDTNINIIGKVTGKNIDDYLNNLEKSFINFNTQTHDHKKKSDDKCREIYGMSNIERYNKLKADALKFKSVKTVEKVTSTDNETLDSSQVQQLGEFVSQVYDNMQVVNEIEKLKVNKHRRFNDTPYFTPTELIDMGVHGNHNFYSNEPDNDGLITNIKVATWFDSYKDMCMDHIFEDYRKDWIDTLDMLYSDFEDIKSSGDEEKILARKQSILDLGWNPEIPFNRKNRLKASKRVSKILDETIPRDIFINLDDIAEEDDIVEEQITKQTHKPVLLIFTQGKTPVVSQGIKFFTGSNYSHASISFDPELNELYSYNMRGENFGFVKENLSSFKDNVISVMAFFAPNNIIESLKNKINDFKDNKTTFDLRIFLNKILHIDHKVSKNEFNQVCSTFVDTVLKSGGINLVGDIEIPDPGQLYNASKSVPNKIIEVFNDIATKYNGKSVKKKLNTLYNKRYISIEEGISILNESIFDKISGKYEAPGPSLVYKDGKFFSKTIRQYKNIILPIKIWEQSTNNPFLTKDDIISAIFIPQNLKEITTIPKNKHIYRVTYCNNKSNVILVYEDLDEVEKYLKSKGKTLKDYSFKSEEITDISISDKYCYINKKKNENLNGPVFESTSVLNEVLGDIVNGVNPYSTKTFYHVSFDNNLDEEVLKPRIPTWITNELKKDENFIKELEKLKDSNSSEGLGFEEYKTPRVCLSNSIEGCLNAIINEKGRLTLHDKTLYVYTPEKPISEYKHKTNKQILKDGDIFDANTTNEMWILEPVKMKYVGSIVVDKITNEQVKKSANNKNKTNIQYKYKWHWFHKVKYRYDSKKNKLVKESKDFTDNINEAYLSGLKDPANISQYHGIMTESNDKGEIIPNECPKCGSKIGVFFAGEPIFKCTNKECKQYFGVVPFKESTSVLNEVKRFPIEFDKEGNLIIYKARIGSLAFGDEIDDSVQLLQAYRNASNIEGIKYELAKLWYINDCIEKKLKKRLSNDEYKELIDTRATCLNVFKTNLDYVMKAEKGFNFSDYYNSTPFSDNSTKITANTLKYTVKTISNMI